MGKGNKFLLTSKSQSATRVNPYDKITSNALNVTCPLKQPPLPKLDGTGCEQVSIELYCLCIFILGFVSQCLNLYRSTWWLSSRRSQWVNYHLIDTDVSQFSLLFIAQSLLISILRAVFNRTSATQQHNSSSSSKAKHNNTITSTNHTNNHSNNSCNNQNNSSSSITNTNHNNYRDAKIADAADFVSNRASLHSNGSNANGSNVFTNSQTSAPITTAPTKLSESTTSSHAPTTSSSAQAKLLSGAATNAYINNNNNNTLTTIATSAASWICNYFLVRCAYRIWDSFGFNGLICISYPIVISIIMNSQHIYQTMQESRKLGRFNLSFLTLSMVLYCQIQFDDDKLCHVCFNQPDEIRDEIEKLKTIFNERLRFIIFKSILIAYYSSFVPICFTQSFLYYDITWTAQHVAITWICSLIMLISCSYTPHFYDVLHRSAFHFGRWQRLESRNSVVPCINWSENVIYPQGVVVKHYRGYFRSECASNCAQPGNASHLRYYIVFSNPKNGFTVTLALLAAILTLQMYLLLITHEWYKSISMTNMMLINVFTIYKLVKSLVVTTKIYKKKN